MKQAKVVLISKYGDVDQLYIDQLDIMSPASNQVRIKIVGASVNPFDIKIRSGLLREWLPLKMPAPLGTDFSGVIDAIGHDVTKFNIGDRVTGFCETSEKGTYAEYINISTSNVVLVPDELDLIDIAAAPTGVLTGTQLIEQSAMLKSGERILITGANGSVGRAAIFAAIDAGAIVFAGVRKTRINSVSDLPVHAIIDIEDESDLKSMGLVDVIVDTVGINVIENLHKYLKINGRISTVGSLIPIPYLLSTQAYNNYIVHFDAERLAKFFDDMIIFKRRLPIAKRFALEDVKKAHEFMEQGKLDGKIVLLP